MEEAREMMLKGIAVEIEPGKFRIDGDRMICMALNP